VTMNLRRARLPGNGIMLRSGLLATTFLIVVSTFSLASARAAAISGDWSGGIAIVGIGSEENRASTPQPRLYFGNPGRDRNGDFLCTYGYKVYFDAGRESGYSWIDWQHYAVPITGQGVSVTEIIVTDNPAAGSSSFSVGIYENTNGRPGNLIAGAKGKAKGSCRLTTVAIARTFLAKGTKYWVEEDAPRRARGTNAVSWGYKPNARQNAYYQYYSANSSSSSLSDWLPVSGPAPFVKVK
jgi:hypothetical protein